MTFYNNLALFTRMKSVAEAVTNTDAPEKEYRAINCFAVGPRSWANTDNLEKKESTYFYSRSWNAASNPVDAIQKDWPLLLVQPPSRETVDVQRGPVIYNVEGILVDLYKRDRAGSESGEYATRTEEEIWDDTATLVDRWIASLEVSPDLRVVSSTRPVIEPLIDWGNNRMAGVQFRFQLRATIDFCNHAVSDPCPECDTLAVTVNSSTYDAEVSTDIDIPVHDSNGADVGTVNAGVAVTVGDSTVNVNGASYDTVEAEGTLNVNVHNSANADVGTVNAGVDVEIPDVTLDYPDGTTEDVVYTTSDVVLTPHWTIDIPAGATSFSTTVPSNWDATFDVSSGGQTLVGGGTISNISINGAAAVSSFEGQTLTATHTVTGDIAGTVTRIELETE